MYISVLSRIYDCDGNVILGKRDLRFTRRLVRDFKHRNSSAETTYAIWKNVKLGEDKYLFPFEHLADIKINSFHPCEPCIFSQRVIDLLRNVGDGEFKEKADSLISKLSLFENIDYSVLPADSLLREFTG